MVVNDLEVVCGVRAHEDDHHVRKEDSVDDPVEGVGGGVLDVEAHLPRGPEDAYDEQKSDKNVPHIFPSVLRVNDATPYVLGLIHALGLDAVLLGPFVDGVFFFEHARSFLLET